MSELLSIILFCVITFLFDPPIAEGAAVGQEIELEVIADRVQQCVKYPDLPHLYKNITMSVDPDTDILYVSGTLVQRTPLEPGTTGLLTLKRCRNEESNSCEKYLTAEIDDFCSHLREKDKMWTPIIENLKGWDPHCPVAEGTYTLTDAPIDISSVKTMYNYVGHWQAEVLLKYNGENVVCVEGDGTLEQKRSKS